MNIVKLGIGLSALACAIGATAPAEAISTFAQFSQTGTASNIYFSNTPTGGSLFTVANNSATTAGTAKIKFTFLDPATGINSVNADFNLSATTVDHAIALGSGVAEPDLTGSFTIKLSAATIINGTSYAKGTNLLSGSFSDMSIIAFGSAGGITASTSSGSTMSYTSAFKTFAADDAFDLGFTLSAMSPSAGFVPGHAMNSFRGSVTGGFSSGPVDLAVAVPEPASWAMMVGGLGLMGAAMRRKRGVPALG